MLIFLVIIVAHRSNRKSLLQWPFLLKLLLFDDLLLLLRIVQAIDAIDARDKVRMIRIDVAVLNCDQVLDHLVGRLQTIAQIIHHFVVDSLPKALES